jgi:hypothetical protein
MQLNEPGEARRQYQKLCQDLWEDLNGRPSAATTLLVQNLL